MPYLQTFRHDFIRLDDGVYVTENPVVQLGLSWSNIVWAFTTFSAGNWHPLTWISHMIDCQVFGFRPGWHHLINVLLHAANTALLFVALRSMTKGTWRSALVAALFALHPLHVESVAWIAERKDVSSTFFGFLALLAYTKYARAPAWNWKLYFATSCFFALSLLSKPMWVTFPILLLLLDVWPLRRIALGGQTNVTRSSSISSIVLEKLPLLVMSAISSVLTFKAQHASGAVSSVESWPLSQRLANAVVAYATYLVKTFWPARLSIIYPVPDQVSSATIIASLLVLLGITIGVCALFRHRPWLAVGWFWFLGTLVPVIGLVQVGAQSMADRYTYLPLIGIFIMIAWGLPAIVRSRNSRHRMAISTAIVALALTALATVTFVQASVWQNTITLCEHALKATSNNYMVHNLLAGALREKGDLAGAQDQVNKSLQLRSNYPESHYTLGTIFLQQKDFAKAQQQFRIATQTKAQDAGTWNALGIVTAQLGQLDEAVADYNRALALNPNYAFAYSNLGAVLVVQEKYDEAIEMCEKALRLKPDHADTHAALGAALWNRNRIDESIRHSRRAIELKPDMVDARYNLGWALLKSGKYDEAIKQLEEVLRLDPKHPSAQTALNSARQERDHAAHP